MQSIKGGGVFNRYNNINNNIMTKEQLKEAKESLKEIIINEKGYNFYLELISEKIKWINEFKLIGDKVFGRDDEMFRKEVLNTIYDSYDNDNDRMYNICIIDLAMDVLID